MWNELKEKLKSIKEPEPDHLSPKEVLAYSAELMRTKGQERYAVVKKFRKPHRSILRDLLILGPVTYVLMAILLSLGFVPDSCKQPECLRGRIVEYVSHSFNSVVNPVKEYHQLPEEGGYGLKGAYLFGVVMLDLYLFSTALHLLYALLDFVLLLRLRGGPYSDAK